MSKRPRSVTVICWFLIITSCLSLVMSTIGLSSSDAREIMPKGSIPNSVQVLMMYAGLIVTLVCGASMLSGLNWARFLYFAWSVIGFIISLATSPVKTYVIPGFIIFLIIAYFLFRQNANEYFTATAAAEAEA